MGFLQLPRFPRVPRLCLPWVCRDPSGTHGDPSGIRRPLRRRAVLAACGAAPRRALLREKPSPGARAASRLLLQPTFQLRTGHGGDRRFNVEGPGHESGSGLRAGGPAAAVGPRKEGERVVGPKGAERGSGGPRMAAPSPPPTSSPGGLAAPEGPGGCTVSQGDSRGATAFPLSPRTPLSIPWENANQEKNETRFSRSRRGLFTQRHGAGASGGSHGKGQAGRGQSRPFRVL